MVRCRGTFEILVKSDGTTRAVGLYDNRGSFGELALMYNTPRAATIVATSPGALWCLVSDSVILWDFFNPQRTENNNWKN